MNIHEMSCTLWPDLNQPVNISIFTIKTHSVHCLQYVTEGRAASLSVIFHLVSYITLQACSHLLSLFSGRDNIPTKLFKFTFRAFSSEHSLTLR